MSDIPLSDFCKRYSQQRAAEIIGCTQSAVSQMIKSHRTIFFRPIGVDVYDFYEIKVPSKKKAA